jgi:hypothetical protein
MGLRQISWQQQIKPAHRLSRLLLSRHAPSIAISNRAHHTKSPGIPLCAISFPAGPLRPATRSASKIWRRSGRRRRAENSMRRIFCIGRSTSRAMCIAACDALLAAMASGPPIFFAFRSSSYSNNYIQARNIGYSRKCNRTQCFAPSASRVWNNSGRIVCHGSPVAMIVERGGRAAHAHVCIRKKLLIYRLCVIAYTAQQHHNRRHLLSAELRSCPCLSPPSPHQ